MPNMESLKRTILTECEEDHVGLWSVIRDVEEFLPRRNEAAIKEQVIKLLQELLLANEIKAGFPTEAGKFRSLRLTPEKIVARIEKEWPINRRPTIGEGLWFARATNSGRTMTSYIEKYGSVEGPKMYRRLQREAGLASVSSRHKKHLRRNGR